MARFTCENVAPPVSLWQETAPCGHQGHRPRSQWGPGAGAAGGPGPGRAGGSPSRDLLEGPTVSPGSESRAL